MKLSKKLSLIHCKKLIVWQMVMIVKGYQNFISPILPSTCRFNPSCSQYAIDALRKYGPAKGLAKTIWRIIRCNPCGGSGYDPP